MVGRQSLAKPASLSAFARDLGDLRLRAKGSPSYEVLAADAGWPAATLRDAASGDALPPLEVVLAFVAACGGDTEEWWERWLGLHVALRKPGAEPVTFPPPEPLTALEPQTVPEPLSEPEPLTAPEPQPESSPAVTGHVRPADSGDEWVPEPVAVPDDAHAAPVAPLRPEDPEHLGAFQLRGRLPGGPVGQVYLASGTGLGLVALRVITPDPTGAPAFRERLATEVAAALRARSPYSAAVISAQPWGNTPWIATAYVAGPTLSEAIAHGGRLRIRDVRTLASALAEALNVHHRVGVQHRALGPHNIRLGAEGPVTLDFGLARTVNVPRLAAQGRREAAAFLAPEQVGGRGSTPASDVFALGGLLAYAATGHLPFGDGSAGDLLQRIARADPLPEALAIEDSELRDLVTACLHADPGRRPTAAQVVAMATAHRKKTGRSPRSRRRGSA